MPELPEVETVRRALEKRTLHRRVKEYVPLRPDYLRIGIEHVKQVKGGRINALQRKGKILAVHLDNGWTLLHHLGMSGRLLLANRNEPVELHTHVRIVLDNGAEELRQRDPRRFGYIGIILQKELEKYPPWARMGTDPFEITPGELCANLQGRKRPIKPLLLEQSIIGGLGNIYVDESLFRAGIHPTRPACELSLHDIKRLLRHIRQVLSESIAAGGSSTSDFQTLDGTLGEFQMKHRVYGREGKECKKCGEAIECITLGGRSSHFCPACQK